MLYIPNFIKAQGQCQSIFALQCQNAKMAVEIANLPSVKSIKSAIIQKIPIKRHASNLKMPPSLSADSLTLPSQMGVV